jgi:hypothetical protein
MKMKDKLERARKSVVDQGTSDDAATKLQSDLNELG